MSSQTSTETKAPKTGASPVVAAQAATSAEPSKVVTSKKGRVKKEDMVYSILFVGGEKNEESNRIPQNVKLIKVKGADNKVKIIDLSKIPQDVKDQLAADGLRKKISFFLKDVTKSDVGKVQTLTDELVKVINDKTLYIPKEGGGPGRTFDFDFWIAVLERTATLKVKAGNTKVKLMSDKAKAEARLKLEAMAPDERKEKQKKWQQDKVFNVAMLQIRAERANAKMAEEETETEEYDATQDF